MRSGRSYRARDELRQTRDAQESIVRWLTLLAPLLLAVFVVAAFRADPGPGFTGRGLVITVAVVAFPTAVLLRNATVAGPRRPVHIGSVAVLLASSIALMGAQPGGPGAVAVLVSVPCVVFLLPRRAAIPVLVSAFVLVEVAAMIAGQGLGDLAVIAAFGAFYGMLIIAFRLGRANRAADQLLVELERNQAAQARAVGLAERQRLAREMHDVLAHSLSGLMLQIEAARLLAASDPTDPRLAGIIERAHQLGRAGLDEARGAIGMLRDDELPGPDKLLGLADRFHRDRGVPCPVIVAGEPRDLDAQTRLTVYRVAQEALTNITKHAEPDRVEIRLTYDAAETRLVVEDFVSDDGIDQNVSDESMGGYGLTGMRERAELLGARLTTGATGRGFRVELAVPA